ncbi:MAG: phosphogluconate dehydratase, partial [Steroidobacteraceae bacterium]
MTTAVPLHPRVRAITERIRERSADPRTAYLERMEQARSAVPTRTMLSCTNLAHGFAAMDPSDKDKLRAARWPN